MPYALNCCMQIEAFVCCCVLLLFQSTPHPNESRFMFIIVQVFTVLPRRIINAQFKYRTTPRSSVFLLHSHLIQLCRTLDHVRMGEPDSIISQAR